MGPVGPPRSVAQRRDLPQMPLVPVGMAQPRSGRGRQVTSGLMPVGSSVRQKKSKGAVVWRATMP